MEPENPCPAVLSPICFNLTGSLREVAGAHRVTVHGGDRVGGLGPLGGEIHSKCSSGRAFQGDDLDRAGLGNIRQNTRAGLWHGQRRFAIHADKASSREKSPDLPPLLRTSAIASIRIERSTAFNMS